MPSICENFSNQTLIVFFNTFLSFILPGLVLNSLIIEEEMQLEIIKPPQEFLESAANPLKIFCL
jgi:hypothetical protein